MRIITSTIMIVVLSSLANAQPPLNWLEFYSQVPGQNEFVGDVAFDGAGNTYMTGRVFEAGESDNIFTVKIGPDGLEVFRDVYNGAYNGPEESYGLFVDAAGNLYVTGRTQIDASSYSVVVIKYSPAGNRDWAYVYPFPSLVAAQGNSIVVDSGGTVYVGGFVQGSGTTSGQDILVLKLDSMGNHLDELLLTQASGQTDECYDIALGPDGNIYLTAFSWASVTDGYEVFVAKIDSNLDIFWTKHINGTDNSLNEFPVDLIVDGQSNVHVLARIQNDGTGTDFAVYKYESLLGGVLWSMEFDANGGQDIPEDMVLDDGGNVFVTGRVRRTAYNDIGVIKYSSGGVEEWVSYYDGPNNLDDDPVGIALAEGTNIAVCGESNRTGSNFEFIVIEFDQNGSFEWEYVYDVNASSKAFEVFLDGGGFLRSAGEGEGPGGDQDFMALSFAEALDVENDAGLPVRTELFQNYPNPFNPTTEIRYRIPETGHVSLTIFDLLGREVSRMVDERQSAGSYTVTWDAAGLPGGVYFYRLMTESFSETRKLVLLR